MPDKIYFLLTRRRYKQHEKRLRTDAPYKQLDLTDSRYHEDSQKDVKDYIGFCINDHPDYKDNLHRWIKKRGNSPADFIEKVALKSEKNFMYLYHVLKDIAEDNYNDLSLNELPNGLQEYYQQHWKRMKMNTPAKSTNAIVLCVMVAVGKPIDCKSIARITHQNEDDIVTLLNNWIEFLRIQKQDDTDYYSIYHQSFADFLGREQPDIKKEKNKNNIDWQEVYRLISESNDQLWASLKQDEEEDEDE